jgi:hypothetical protein
MWERLPAAKKDHAKYKFRGKMPLPHTIKYNFHSNPYFLETASSSFCLHVVLLHYDAR